MVFKVSIYLRNLRKSLALTGMKVQHWLICLTNSKYPNVAATNPFASVSMTTIKRWKAILWEIVYKLKWNQALSRREMTYCSCLSMSLCKWKWLNPLRNAWNKLCQVHYVRSSYTCLLPLTLHSLRRGMCCAIPGSLFTRSRNLGVRLLFSMLTRLSPEVSQSLYTAFPIEYLVV